jgi:hypothetical protein
VLLAAILRARRAFQLAVGSFVAFAGLFHVATLHAGAAYLVARERVEFFRLAFVHALSLAMHSAVRGVPALGFAHVGASLDADLAMHMTMHRGCASGRLEDVTAIFDALRIMHMTV